ncbi:MAG: polyprenol monophosphomannose synthase [Armatimonadetes bacterium]|nr:polyprenol monophosphomannose synthase [Anaerolineae bacterium]
MPPKIVIVLPTYNEAENLPLMVAALMALPIPHLHVLVVDDKSPDGTGALADTLAAQHPAVVSVLHRAGKEGLGPAYKAGFKQALADGADQIIQMDCDFSHPPEYVVPLLAKLNEGWDVVHGSRYVRGGGVDQAWGWYRKLLSWFANRVYVKVLLRIPVNDATCGFRAWQRATLLGLDVERIASNGYVFQVELTYVTHRLGYRIAEIPIYFPDRQRGDSKMDSGIALEASLRVWQMMQRHRGLSAQGRRVI